MLRLRYSSMQGYDSGKCFVNKTLLHGRLASFIHKQILKLLPLDKVSTRRKLANNTKCKQNSLLHKDGTSGNGSLPYIELLVNLVLVIF